jgi:hypothetical protein
MRFLEYKDLGLGMCAIFDDDYPSIDANGNAYTTFALNRNSLESRINNLKAGGYDTKVEEIALENWPKE